MPRKPVTDPHKAWNVAHAKRLEAYNKRIEQLLNRAITQCADLALRHGAEATPERPFTYAQDRQLKAETERLLRDLSDEITMVTKEGEGKEWEQAYKQATEYLSQVYNVAKQTEALQAAFDERLLGMKTRNLDALNAFQNRKIGGLKLSDKVWNYTQDFEKQMEVAIDQALLEGKSAQSLSRDIRSLLIDPDALFRRVRGDDDQLRMSRAMAAYHPGQGRYRSAYMNAMRLARSEINIAYRSSDSQTAQEFDACVGIEVHLSNNHNCKGVPEGEFYDICDELQGRYPKDFKFVGWHPQCYDEDSEVYTADGWKYFSEVDDNDLILSLNPETRDLEYVGILHNIYRHYKGQMVHFFNRSYSQFVTPEHEVLCLSKQDNRTFRRIQSDKCGKTQPIYRSSEWKGRKIEFVTVGSYSVPFTPFAKFMGYWLSDGSLGHKYAILIAQEDADRSRIYDCIAEMGMKPRYNGGKIEFNDKDWYEYLQQFGKAADKFVPAEIKESDKDGIRIFLNAFVSCDGYVKKVKPFVGNRGNLCVPNNDERTYCTTSKRMADDIGELILKVGCRPSFRVSHTAGKQHQFKNGVYTINYDCITITECHSQCATQYNKEYMDYDGMVYDLTLERNNTMYIRRNGKCFWGSNCRCYTTYILKTDEEFWDDIMSGENNESINTVDDVPDNFKKWLSENKERIDKSEKKGTLPYFLRDNKVYWDYIETPATPVISTATPKLSIQERAAIRHAARTQEEIDRIKADWQKRLEIPELDGSIQQLKGLNKPPQRRSNQTWEEYLEEWYNYGEKLYGKNSSIGKGIDFWRNSPSNSESVIRSRINYLQTSISAPAGIGDIDAILRYDTDKLPWQWRTTYAKFIKELNANASMIETDGAFGFANTFKHREIESLANMINLTKNDDAVRYGLDKLSWKTPAIFFNGSVMKFGERYLLPEKKFFDSLSEFVPMTTHNGYRCFYYPSDRKVHIGMGKKAVERVTKSRWQAKNVMHHEFTHANDALNDWCNNKDVVDWWDAFVKKVNDTDYGKELEEKIKELNSKKHTADQEEQLGKLSDILQAAKKDHAFIEPRGHEKSYYSSKEKQIKEFLAHCGEAYWGGNPVIKELDEDLYNEMLKVMNMLVG